ncbi:MAG: ATP-grasp domain-containing protein [Myxococcota bacterium]
MAEARILVLGCGFPQLGLLQFCKAEGLFTVGADMNPRAVGRALCDAFVPASIADVDALVVAAREFRVDGVVSAGSELAVLPTCLVAKRLGLPFYGSESVVRGCHHKDEMRLRYNAGGAPSPRFERVSSVSEGHGAAARIGLPVVIKPCRGWGQRGVRVVKTREELDSALEAAFAAVGKSEDARCLVEEFIDGREFSVDAYTRDGRTQVLAVTERIITQYPEPPGITYAEVYPPEVSSLEQLQLEQAAIAGVAALGIERGPSYTQVRLDQRGAFLVETAYRLGGGLDPEVTFLASGVSLYRRILGVALTHRDWESSGPEAPRHAGATGRFLVAKPGIVHEISGLAAARGVPGVLDAQVYVGVSDRVHPLTDGSKRAGHVLAVGSGRADAEARAFRAMEQIRIVTSAASAAGVSESAGSAT